jgi:formylglycine-generating enzyme
MKVRNLRWVPVLASAVGFFGCSTSTTTKSGGVGHAGSSGASAAAGGHLGSAGAAGEYAATLAAGSQNLGGTSTNVAGTAGISGNATLQTAGGKTASTAGGASSGASAVAGAGASSVLTGGTVATGGVTIATGGRLATGGSPSTGGAVADCPGATGGPPMVKTPGGYCIDSTEVTRSQYAQWLETTTTTTINAQNVTDCGWNTTFTPSGDWTDPTARPNFPIANVDWCDAYAYCKGVGKRLCGKIGGGTNLIADYADASMSQWYAACSSGGTKAYPYGATYAATSCNGYDYWATPSGRAAIDVGSLSLCQGTVPYAGVYDLSGNVLEWEDSCDPATSGQGSNCRVRGGCYASSSGGLGCASALSYSRGDARATIGFRCCSP